MAAPVTIAIIGLIVAGLIGSLVAPTILSNRLSFRLDGLATHPWAALSYPFDSGGNVLTPVFAGMWLWWFGASVERDLGSARFAAFWVLVTALSAGAVGLGWIVGSTRGVLLGPWLPIASVTVAWGTRYPEVPVGLMFVVSLAGKWVALLAGVLVLFGYGGGAPIVGVFAVLPLVGCYYFAADKIGFLPFRRAAGPRASWKAHERRDSGYFADVRKREKERDERERLRKLFESSLDDDQSEGGARG